MSRWKKDRSFSIKNSGYHSYFGISSSALNNNIDFEVCDDATKGQIKSAFAKSLSSKKMNKKILGEFVELIV
jgi:predicted HAD superfamily hydrolase